MSKYLIRKEDQNEMVRDAKFLDVNELFFDTIQGEGSGSGYPAVFLRLQGCTLDCTWCDTQWRLGSRYSFDLIFEMMEKSKVIDRLKNGHRLILTGGSPLKQQEGLSWFFHCFERRYNFIPFIEVENECTLMPEDDFSHYVCVWNNSPKLENSGMKKAARIKPKVLKYMSSIEYSWFKFVVSLRFDWLEIQKDFIDPGYIKKHQIILMPLAGDNTELVTNRWRVAQMAIKHGVRYSTREQLILGLP